MTHHDDSRWLKGSRETQKNRHKILEIQYFPGFPPPRVSKDFPCFRARVFDFCVRADLSSLSTTKYCTCRQVDPVALQRSHTILKSPSSQNLGCAQGLTPPNKSDTAQLRNNTLDKRKALRRSFAVPARVLGFASSQPSLHRWQLSCGAAGLWMRTLVRGQGKDASFVSQCI